MKTSSLLLLVSYGVLLAYLTQMSMDFRNTLIVLRSQITKQEEKFSLQEQMLKDLTRELREGIAGLQSLHSETHRQVQEEIQSEKFRGEKNLKRFQILIGSKVSSFLFI